MQPLPGNWRRSAESLVGLVLASLLIGCASPQAGDQASCEQDKAALLATIRQQRDEVGALRDKTASLERRLAESETEIARLDPTRRVRGPASPAEAGGVPWRPPSVVAQENSSAAPRR